MESVWWVFKSLVEKNLVYRGYKVMPFSTACATPLSNFEAGLNYKDVQDPAVVVAFPLKDDPEVSVLWHRCCPCWSDDGAFVARRCIANSSFSLKAVHKLFWAPFRQQNLEPSQTNGRFFSPILSFFAPAFVHNSRSSSLHVH